MTPSILHRLRLAAQVLRYGQLGPRLPRVECPQRHPVSGSECILLEGHAARQCLAIADDGRGAIRWTAERRKFPRVPALGAVWRWR